MGNFPLFCFFLNASLYRDWDDAKFAPAANPGYNWQACSQCNKPLPPRPQCNWPHPYLQCRVWRCKNVCERVADKCLEPVLRQHTGVCQSSKGLFTNDVSIFWVYYTPCWICHIVVIFWPTPWCFKHQIDDVIIYGEI